MAVPVAPRIRAFVVSKGKVKIAFKAVPDATSYRLYSGGTTRVDPITTGRNEKQTVTISATSGTFKLTYSAQQTAAIAFDATAAQLQSALEALSNIAIGDVSVSKVGSVFTVEFTGLLARTNVSVMTSDATSLSGASHSATVATTVAGIGPADTSIDPGEIVDLTVGTRGIYAVRAANAEGEGPISNIVSLADRDYVAVFVGEI